LRVPTEKLQCTEKHPWSAKPALQAVMFPEGLLKRMELSNRRQPFNGGHLRPVCLNGEHETGTDRLAVHHHGASAADTVFAAHVSTGKAQTVAEEIGEQKTRLDYSLILDTVDP
jgi:hypothetical protein